jgi:hypothetical protein
MGNGKSFIGSAGVRIFTVVPGESTVTEMLCVPSLWHSMEGSGNQVLLLSNGNLLIRNFDGLGDGYSYYYTYYEYELDGYTFQLVSSLKFNHRYHDDDWRDLESGYFNDEYLLNEEQISEDDFNNYVANYCRMLTFEFSMIGGDYESPADWDKKVADIPNYNMSFDEAWEYLKTA